jgi:CHAT domain-containing protein/tetratricopeptide (TPR) repeat protein
MRPPADIQREIACLKREIDQLCQRERYEEAMGLATRVHDLTRACIGEESPDFVNSLNNLAALYLVTDDYAVAAPLLQQALKIGRAILGELHPDLVGILQNLATLYQTMGNYAEAEPFLQKILAIQRAALGEDHPDLVDTLNSLAEGYEVTRNYVAAEPLYCQALRIQGTALGESHPDFATGLINVAELYQMMGRYTTAEPLYQRALEIDRKALGESHPQTVSIMNNLAVLYLKMGKYGDAESLLQQAVEMERAHLGEEHPDFATSLHNLAGVYLEIANYAAAEPLYQRALEITRKALGKDHPEVGTCLNTLAGLYLVMGNYTAAEALYQEGLEIRRKALGEAHPDVATSLSSLAGLYHERGNYAAAELQLQQALEVSRMALGETHPEVGTVLNALAGLYLEIGNYAKAKVLYQQVQEIQRKALGEQSPILAITLENLAVLYLMVDDYAAAEPLLRRASAINRTALGEHHPEVAISLNNLAALYHHGSRNYAEAESLYRQALTINLAALGPDHPALATGLSNLGVVRDSMGDYAGAESLYLQALEKTRSTFGEDHPQFANIANNLASLYVAMDRKAEAMRLIERATAIDERMIGQIFSISSENQRMAYLSILQTHFDAFLSLVLQDFSDSPTAVQVTLDLVLRRKAIGAEALAAQRDAVLGGRYPELKSKLQELIILRIQIAQKTLNGPGPEGLSAHQQLLARWNAQRERLEAELARQIPEMNLQRQLRTANRQAIAQALPAGAVLVELVRIRVYDFKAVPARGESRWKPARYLAFVLCASELNHTKMIDLGEADPIDQKIAAFRASITGEIESSNGEPAATPQTEMEQTSADTEETESEATRFGRLAGRRLRSALYREAGIAIRAAVFDVLLPALRGGKRLFLAPDGDLSQLPFEVLPLDEDRYLLDEYQISYLGVGRDMLRFRTVSTDKAQPALVIANPDFNLGKETMQSFHVDHPFPKLNGTREEGQAVADLLKVKPFMTNAALKSTLKAYHSPTILHIATHGFFQNDPPRDRNLEQPLTDVMGGAKENRLARLGRMENPLLRSGLALAGANTWAQKGTLPPEAEDGILTAEDVTGLDLLDTELIVLSACETGLGAVHVGEGVFGLRRAFILAGAKTLVMSLWKLPDHETRELMTNFYHYLLEGSSRTDALRRAQLAMRETRPHPFYWGAFICQGNPGPLLYSSICSKRD